MTNPFSTKMFGSAVSDRLAGIKLPTVGTEGLSSAAQGWLSDKGADISKFSTGPALTAGLAGLQSSAAGAIGGFKGVTGGLSSVTGGLASPDYSLSGGTTVPSDMGASGNDDLAEDQKQFGYKVRLFAVRNYPSEHVIFNVTPTFSEARAVEYSQVAPVHLPGSIQVYKRTGSRTFSVGAKFVSRNQTQATENMKFLQILRGWTMPYFGVRDYASGTGRATAESEGVVNGMQEGNATYRDESSMLGAPPDVLYLFAYSSSTGDSTDRSAGQGLVNIKKVPVVITNLNITYPDDVDYIPVLGTGEPFPVKMDVTIELVETHSPEDYEKFSLSMFKQGTLVQF